MTSPAGSRYDRRMRAQLVAGAICAAAVLAVARPALAATTVFDDIGAPLVRATLQSGNLRIRAWDRPQVRIEADDGVSVDRKTVTLPGQRDIPIFEGRIQGRRGPIVLPAETFVVNNLPAGKRDLVALSGAGNATLWIPASAPLVVAQIVRGSVSLSDYRTGTFILRVRNGAALLASVGGEGYVQVMRGSVGIEQSAIERLRVRTALADIFFAGCHVRQIEATSVEGSIFFDDGSFEPGLARFSTESGSVALGIAGGANVTAHAPEGQIYALLDKRANVNVSGGDGTASFWGGGPLVTASSATADVYLYSGTLRNRRDLPPVWVPFLQSLAAGTAVPAIRDRLREIVPPARARTSASRRRPA
jgi:hypothetical protein